MATSTQKTTTSSGPISNDDIDDWKNRFNEVLAQPGAWVNNRSPDTARPWHAGLFECFSPLDTCLVTWCLPCVTFGKTHHRLRKGGGGDLAGYEPVNTSCLLFCGSACVGLPWLLTALQRHDLREKHHLQGSCLVDLATACCCGCCDLVQQDKEAAYREQEKMRARGIEVGYTTNEEMVMPK
ncbi:PLAC8 family-domain-containing protein [Xylariaceae sp. FL0594]|nr:PLAC8 family-domain-containing protein [Xylariaceae sp. FL0594]